MRKRNFCLLIVLILLMSVFTGCGAAKEADKSTASSAPGIVAKDSYGQSSAKPEEQKGEETPEKANGAVDGGATASGIVATGTEVSKRPNLILSQRKVIRNAEVSIEVENFDRAFAKIQNIVEGTGTGYIQESNINRDKIYVEGEEKYITRGMIIARVSADEFSERLNAIKGLGLVLGFNTKSDDVTEKFYDVESQLRLLKYEQSRLEQYLNKITDPDTIFKTEDKLTQIRHEIESLTGTLNKLGDLVKLSTITINVNEKYPVGSQKSGKEASYWSKVSKGFTDSAKGVAEFFAALLLFLVQAVPVLIPLALTAWIAYLVYKKFGKKRRKESDVSETPISIENSHQNMNM